MSIEMTVSEIAEVLGIISPSNPITVSKNYQKKTQIKMTKG